MDFFKWYRESMIFLFLVYLIIFFMILDSGFAIAVFKIVIIPHILGYFLAGMVVQIFLKKKNGESLRLYELLLNSFALSSLAYLTGGNLLLMAPIKYAYLLTMNLLIMVGAVSIFSYSQYKTSKIKSLALGVTYSVCALIFTLILDQILIFL